MAISATTEWEVRTTGSDSNGGGFDVASTGTDYSQQDSAHVTYSDLAIGSTSTKLSSSAHPFASDHVGNIVNITGGTGFTVQRVQVVSVASGVATVDKSLGTINSTGGAGKLGGAVANIAAAASAVGSGNTVHVKAGTYTYTSATSWTPAAAATRFSVVGYEVTRLDAGAKPLITTATNSADLVNVGSLSQLLFVSNISFSTTAGTPARGITNTSGLVGPAYFADCIFDGFTNAFPNPGQNFNPLVLIRCEVKNCTGVAIFQVKPVYIYDSYLHDNANSAISSSNSTIDNILLISGSIIAGSGASGLALNNGNMDLRVDRCVFYNNADGAIKNISAATPNSMCVQNSIFYGNGWGININLSLGAFQTALCRNNAFGNNSLGDVHNYTKSSSDKALTADPFTNAASGDFTLNSASGGGGACKGAGYPGAFPGGTTTSATDIGAAQSGSGGGGSTPTNYGWIG